MEAFYLVRLDVICLAVLTGLIIFLLTRKGRANLPPGPFAWPLIGNLAMLDKQVHLQISKLSEKYGPVFRLYFGPKLVIVVSGRKLVEECLNTRTIEFSMRPDFITTKYILKGRSFAFGNTTVARHLKLRKLAMWAMKNSLNSSEKNAARHQLRERNNEETAFIAAEMSNNNSLEEQLSEDANELGNKLVDIYEQWEATHGTVLHPSCKSYTEKFFETILTVSVKTMASTILVKRYEYNDAQLKVLAKCMNDFKTIDQKVGLINFCTIARVFCRKHLKSYIALCESYTRIVEKHIQMQKKKLENHNLPNNSTHSLEANMISNVLVNKAKTDEENEADATTVVGDMFGASVDTTSVALMWIILYFAKFPFQFYKVQAAIDDFYGKNGRLPSFEERHQVPQMLAFIQETLRHTSILPFTIPHTPVHDTTLGGYSIPHGAVIMISLWSLNKDQEFWGDPETFRPDRYFDDNNEYDRRLAQKVNVHGAGRRGCPGKNFSEMVLFTFAANLARSFDFKCFGPDANVLPKALLGISLTPEIIDVKVTERQSN
ncbi:cytochrome P450 1A1-like [Clavelina lepadiformis]|uniref:cytochrome P450 1A1-like n=1 Tax=Clavelina lepadiformis TaxID=159417 RepID=UPI004041B0C3